MRSLHAELAAVPDFRRAQGKKHTVARVLTVHVLAEIANMKGCLAAAQFARAVPEGAGGRRRVAEPEDGRSPPTASASGAPTATARAITRPWPLSTMRAARPSRS